MSNRDVTGGENALDPKDRRYRDVLDALVAACREGQGQIGARRARSGVWNAAATPTSMPDQHAQNVLLSALTPAQRETLAEMLTQQFVAGVHQALATLHAEGITPFDAAYDTTRAPRLRSDATQKSPGRVEARSGLFVVRALAARGWVQPPKRTSQKKISPIMPSMSPLLVRVPRRTTGHASCTTSSSSTGEWELGNGVTIFFFATSLRRAGRSSGSGRFRCFVRHATSQMPRGPTKAARRTSASPPSPKESLMKTKTHIRAGLGGAKSEQAFYVRTGLGDT